MVSLFLTLKIFHTNIFFTVSTVHFEQKNVYWVFMLSLLNTYRKISSVELKNLFARC